MEREDPRISTAHELLKAAATLTERAAELLSPLPGFGD